MEQMRVRIPESCSFRRIPKLWWIIPPGIIRNYPMSAPSNHSVLPKGEKKKKIRNIFVEVKFQGQRLSKKLIINNVNIECSPYHHLTTT